MRGWVLFLGSLFVAGCFFDLEKPVPCLGQDNCPQGYVCVNAAAGEPGSCVEFDFPDGGSPDGGSPDGGSIEEESESPWCEGEEQPQTVCQTEDQRCCYVAHPQASSATLMETVLSILPT